MRRIVLCVTLLASKIAFESQVSGAIDDAHPAPAQHGNDLETVTKDGARIHLDPRHRRGGSG